MGVTIHYRGRLNDMGQLARLCDEVADIAAAMGWESTRFDDAWGQPCDARMQSTPTGATIEGNLGLKGIMVVPGGKVEPLSFCFNREGNVWCPVTRVLVLEGTLKPEEAWVSVKTQFGSPQIHAWIIGLLKYLKKRYMSDLEVSDEGEYWETGDIRKVQEKMDLINRKIEELSSESSSCRLGEVSGLSADEIVSKIEQWFLENGR